MMVHPAVVIAGLAGRLPSSGEALNHFDGIMPLNLVTGFARAGGWSTVIGEMAATSSRMHSAMTRLAASASTSTQCCESMTRD
jgi:hypothetical protein